MSSAPPNSHFSVETSSFSVEESSFKVCINRTELKVEAMMRRRKVLVRAQVPGRPKNRDYFSREEWLHFPLKNVHLY